MKKLLTIITLLLAINCFSQRVVITSDGRLQAECPSCPVCPVCPPPVVKYDTVYKDTGSIRYLHDTVYLPPPTNPPTTGTVNVSFQQVQTEVQNGGRGVEQWHNAFDVPVYGTGVKAMDVYYRFGWY